MRRATALVSSRVLRPLAFILLMAAACSASATNSRSEPLQTAARVWLIEIDLNQSFGSTKTTLTAKAIDPRDQDNVIDIRSELEFPLDAWLVGMRVSWQPDTGRFARWSVSGGIQTNITDPSRKMTDGDWVGSTQISYTESESGLDMILATAGVHYQLLNGARTDLSLDATFESEWIEQKIIGYRGWRRSLFSDERFEVVGTVPVIDYKVRYISPQLGASLARWLGTYARLEVGAGAGPLFARDEDDHLLRGRLSKGEATGIGLKGLARFDLMPGFVRVPWLSVGLLGQIRYFQADGETTQRWYRDEDLPEGTVIPDLPYELESLQYGVGLEIGFSL